MFFADRFSKPDLVMDVLGRYSGEQIGKLILRRSYRFDDDPVILNPDINSIIQRKVSGFHDP
jgi:hypothetical protein